MSGTIGTVGTIGTAEEVKQPTQPVQPEKPAQPIRKPSILNLGAMLSGGGGAAPKAESAPEEAKASAAIVAVDPQSETKIKGAWVRVMEYLAAWRPRYVATFEGVEILGNMIRVRVPSESLREDILRNKSEFLFKLVEIVGVQGVVELDVVLDEAETKSTVPIKLEDRIAHIMSLNPLIVKFKEALDLEVDG
ncbi:MAG: DNA polymerase III subunit gamma/tau [Rikenellaceae bacterium]